MVFIWVTVYLAFIYGLFFLAFGSSSDFDIENYDQANSFLYNTLFWMLLNPGPVDLPEFIDQSGNMTKGEGISNYAEEGVREEVSVPDSLHVRMWFASFAFALYQIIAVILLLNLVIAAMNSTITKLEMSKEKNWKYYRTATLMDFFADRSALPVPFNLIMLPVTLIHLVYVMLLKCLGIIKGGSHEDAHKRMTPEQAWQRNEYLQLMSKLIGRYQNSAKRGELTKSFELPPGIDNVLFSGKGQEGSKTMDTAAEIEALKKLVHENSSMLQELLKRGQNSSC